VFCVCSALGSFVFFSIGAAACVALFFLLLVNIHWATFPPPVCAGSLLTDSPEVGILPNLPFSKVKSFTIISISAKNLPKIRLKTVENAKFIFDNRFWPNLRNNYPNWPEFRPKIITQKPAMRRISAK
jgi:hypothetical protein